MFALGREWGVLLLAWSCECFGKAPALLVLERMDLWGTCRSGGPLLGFGKAWMWAGWGRSGFKRELRRGAWVALFVDRGKEPLSVVMGGVAEPDRKAGNREIGSHVGGHHLMGFTCGDGVKDRAEMPASRYLYGSVPWENHLPTTQSGTPCSSIGCCSTRPFRTHSGAGGVSSISGVGKRPSPQGRQ